LIEQGDFVADYRNAWSEHQPSATSENRFIDEAGWGDLGIDPEEHKQTKARYKFPYGDFERLHRRGVLSAEVRAGQYKYADIEVAAAHLHGLIDGAAKKSIV
jgi:hypothetical protein